MHLEEKHHIAMREARAINMSGDLIFPLIDLMIRQKTDLMVSEFNGGKIEMLSNAAAIAALYELKNTLKNKQSQGNKVLEAVSKEAEKSL